MLPSSTSHTWSPILEGEPAVRAASAVAAVAEAIELSFPERNHGSGLGGGEAGIALFFEYLDRVHPGSGYGEIAQQRLERAIDAMASSSQSPSLYGGFTGVSWVVEHLLRGTADLAGSEGEDPNEDIDEALLRRLRKTPWRSDFDLISGLVGYGVYALERLPRPSAAACLEQVVARLAEIAQPRPEGLTWHYTPELLIEAHRPSYPLGVDDLGVAHGMPGVIALLAHICAAGVAAEPARALLAGAVPWLLAQKLPVEETSVFPYGTGPGVKVRPARTAWCYGDPGIAVALLLAGRAAGEPAWEREALALARTVARRPVESCGIQDACLCHGAGGLGHLLNRLYQATGDPELREGARAWLEWALDFREPGRGLGGFLAFTAVDGDPERLAWSADAGFLGGAAGTALALLAATSGVEPSWDRVLLLSPQPERLAQKECYSHEVGTITDSKGDSHEEDI